MRHISLASVEELAMACSIYLGFTLMTSFNYSFFCMKNNVEGVLNGVSPNTITNSQFTRAFAKAMRRPALFPVPGFVMNLLLGKERAVMLTHGQCVTPKRTIEYGFQYKYCDIEHACKAVSYLIPKNFR